MNKTLLDTDMYSEVLKVVDPTLVRTAIAYRRGFGILTLSAITVMEIVQGYQRVGASRRLQIFHQAIAMEEVLPFDQTTAELAGRIAGDLDRVGRPIGRCDPMIAAVALRSGLVLATGNLAHYQRIEQLGYPLALVNWRN